MGRNVSPTSPPTTRRCCFAVIVHQRVRVRTEDDSVWLTALRGAGCVRLSNSRKSNSDDKAVGLPVTSAGGAVDDNERTPLASRRRARM